MVIEPRTKRFDAEKFSEIIGSLSKNMDGKEFEKTCEPIVMEILQQYEGFEKDIKGPVQMTTGKCTPWVMYIT